MTDSLASDPWTPAGVARPANGNGAAESSSKGLTPYRAIELHKRKPHAEELADDVAKQRAIDALARIYVQIALDRMRASSAVDPIAMLQSHIAATERASEILRDELTRAVAARAARS